MFASSVAAAGNWQPIDIQASLDLRYFPVDSSVTGTEWTLAQQGLVGSEWRSEDRRERLDISLFARWDDRDHGRRDIDIRRLWYSWQHSRVTLAAGVHQEFWGVTESRHLVNVLNQIDAVEDIDEEELLGQPMIKLASSTSVGQFSVYVMPRFRERPRHGYGDRLALPFDISSNSVYESSSEEQHVDVAARYTLQQDALDVGVSYFRGTNREPRLIVDDGIGRDLYEQIEQWAVDAQWTSGSWLAKVEALRRADAIETFSAYVVGVEYTFFQAVAQTDIAIVVEKLKDHRRAPGAPTPYQNDWFGALRVAWNDVHDSSVLFGGYYDRELGETVWRLELERRLNDHWSLDLSVTFFDEIERASAIYPVRLDGFSSLKLTRYF